MKPGDPVLVYTNYLLCKHLEGEATIDDVIEEQDLKDIHGRPLYLCRVRFSADEPTSHLYVRSVSVKQ